MANSIDSRRRDVLVDAARGARRSLAVAIAGAGLCALLAPAASALTPDEVIKLREAGVSNETIQKMIDSESSGGSGVPQNMVDQEYASRHIGSWSLPDGNVVLSTGKTKEAGFDPTLPQNNQYPMNIYPYVFPGGPGGGMPGGAPGPVIAPR